MAGLELVESRRRGPRRSKSGALLPSREKVDRGSRPDEGPRRRQTMFPLKELADRLGAAPHPTGPAGPATFSREGRRTANHQRHA